MAALFDAQTAELDSSMATFLELPYTAVVVHNSGNTTFGDHGNPGSIVNIYIRREVYVHTSITSEHYPSHTALL